MFIHLATMVHGLIAFLQVPSGIVYMMVLKFFVLISSFAVDIVARICTYNIASLYLQF